jgi:hypothetical protein
MSNDSLVLDFRPDGCPEVLSLSRWIWVSGMVALKYCKCILAVLSKSGPDFKAKVSSAKSKILRDVRLRNSLISVRKRAGPSRFPYIL